MGPPSVSRSGVVLEIRGKSRIRIDLKRHLAPGTVGELLRALPLDGNAHFMGGGIVCLESAVGSGIERARRDFRRGDVAFYPADGRICFFSDDALAPRPMSPIGRIVSGADGLAGARPGDLLSLRQEDAGEEGGSETG